MESPQLSRSNRSRFVQKVTLQAGGLWALVSLAQDIWRGRWPHVLIAPTWRFAADLGFEVAVVVLTGLVFGWLLGYLMWYFLRWLFRVAD